MRELLTKHVKVQDKSGREALQNFIGGNGDVLLSYEYEAITANKNGEKLEYVIPDDTIKINIDIATTKDAPAAAKSFVDYVLVRARPGEVRRVGLPAGERGRAAANKDKFPDPPGLFTIDDLGGWEKVNAELFDIEERRDRQDRGGSRGVHGTSEHRSPLAHCEGARPAGRAPSRSASRRSGSA